MKRSRLSILYLTVSDRARIQNFLILALIMSSSPLWALLPSPRTFGSNIQFELQLPISRLQDSTLRKQGILKATAFVSTAFNPLPTFQPEFNFGALPPSPGFQFRVNKPTSYVAEGTIFNFPFVDESNTDIDTRRGVRAPGAIPSIDTCSSHSSGPTPRVTHTKLPRFGGEEDAADNRLVP